MAMTLTYMMLNVLDIQTTDLMLRKIASWALLKVTFLCVFVYACLRVNDMLLIAMHLICTMYLC